MGCGRAVAVDEWTVADLGAFVVDVRIEFNPERIELRDGGGSHS